MQVLAGPDCDSPFSGETLPRDSAREGLWYPHEQRRAIPLASPDVVVSPHFGEAPYFALIQLRVATGEVVGREVLASLQERESADSGATEGGMSG